MMSERVRTGDMSSDRLIGFRLGRWTVHPLRNILVDPDREVHIEPRVMQVLEMLADNQGEVVEREELLETLWNGCAVSDEPLTRSIASLRHALGDNPKNPRYIQTIPKRGYRLVRPIQPLVEPATVTSRLGGRMMSVVVAAVSVTVAIIVADILRRSGQESTPQITVEGSSVSDATGQSVAVLPFRNLSPRAEDTFLVDGIHADILTHLVKVESFDKVIASTSTEQYRGTDKSVSLVARELGVVNLLIGELQRSGDRLRINTQLVDAVTGDYLWAETYDRQITAENLFAIQSEIARSVSSALEIVLSDDEAARIDTVPTSSLEAYGEYVRGQEALFNRAPPDLYRAEIYFRRAVTIDPNFALAYVAVADALQLQRVYDRSNQNFAFAERRELIEKALEIDSNLGEAYASLAQVHKEQREFGAADELFRKALKLKPNFHRIWHWHGLNFYMQRRYEEALTAYKTALELAPDEPIIRIVLSGAQAGLGRYEDSLQTLMEGVRQRPKFPNFYWRIAQRFENDGFLGKGLLWRNAARVIAPLNSRTSIGLCNLQLRLQDYDGAEKCYAYVETEFGETFFRRRLNLLFARSQFDEARLLLQDISQKGQRSSHRRRPGIEQVRIRPFFANGLADLVDVELLDHAEVDQSALLDMAYFWLVLGDSASAMSILRSLEPALFDDDGEVRRDIEFDIVRPKSVEELAIRDDVMLMYSTAAILYRSGDIGVADRLFDELLDILRSARMIERHHDDPGAWVSTLNEIPIHAIRQDRLKTIKTLRNSLDEWNFGWFAQEGPLFDFIREDPEWVDLMNEIERRAARELQWYEEHRHEPLF